MSSYNSMRLSRKYIGLNDPTRIAIHLGITNTRFFQIPTTIRKRRHFIRLWMNIGFCLRTKMLFCRSSLMNFAGDFRKDPNVNIRKAILLFRDVSALDNEWLTSNNWWWSSASGKQIGHLKSLGLDGTHAIFYHKCWNIIRKNVYHMNKAFLHRDIFLRNLMILVLLWFQKGKSQKSEWL